MAETAAELSRCQDNELAPGRVAELGVCRLLSFVCTKTAPVLRLPARRGTPAEARGETGNGFNAALVLPGRINIQVTEADIHGDCGASCPAHAGGPRTGCQLTPEGIVLVTAAATGVRSRRRSITRNREESRDNSCDTGVAVKTLAT